MPSLFPLLQLFLGFVLLAQIVFFRETEEEEGIFIRRELQSVRTSVRERCRVGRKLLGLELDNQAKCKFPFLEAKKAVDDVREGSDSYRIEEKTFYS